MTAAQDAELWDRIRNDDPDAFGLLFERHGERVHRYALRLTAEPESAEDITAIVFLEAWRRRGTVELHQASALPWLYGVTSKVVRQWRRSRRRHRQAMVRLAGLPPRHPALVERQAEAAAESARVLSQIRHLPRRERDVLVLSVWEGLPHTEIAAALSISVGTVKSRLSRARGRLGPDGTTDPTAVPHPPLTLKET